MATACTSLTVLVAHVGTDALAAQRSGMSALSASYLPAIGVLALWLPRVDAITPHPDIIEPALDLATAGE